LKAFEAFEVAPGFDDFAISRAVHRTQKLTSLAALAALATKMAYLRHFRGRARRPDGGTGVPADYTQSAQSSSACFKTVFTASSCRSGG
jgi:hypothetical protein